MIHSTVGDKPQRAHSIESMPNEPSKDELHELAKQRCRTHGVSLWPVVTSQLANIKNEKMSGRLEHGALEHLTVDFFDLTDIIADNGSRVVDIGYESEFWSLLIQGTTNLGDTLQVGVRLSRREDSPLQIASFQKILES